MVGGAVGMVGSTIVSLFSVGISALFPRFDWENPEQATAPGAGLSMLVCLAGLAVLTGLVVALAFAVSGFVPLWVAVTAAAVLWMAGAAIPGYLVFSAGAEHLGRLNWEL